jgi:hypothetical protein
MWSVILDVFERISTTPIICLAATRITAEALAPESCNPTQPHTPYAHLGLRCLERNEFRKATKVAMIAQFYL